MDDTTQFEIDPELLAGFVDEAEEGLEVVDGLFIELEHNRKNAETLSAIFRPIHTVKGNAAFFGLMSTKKLAHEMETVLTLAREDKLILDQSTISILLAGVDQLRAMLARTREQQAEVDDAEAFARLIEKIKTAQKSRGEKSLPDWQSLLAELSRVQQDLNHVDRSCGDKLNAVIAFVERLGKGPSDAETGQAAQAKQAEPAPIPSRRTAAPQRTGPIGARRPPIHARPYACRKRASTASWTMSAS